MNTDTAIKLVVLAILSPLWMPVVKALWHEINHSLQNEGGLLGKKPTARELDKLIERDGIYEFPLVHEPHAAVRAAAAAKRAAGPANTPRRPAASAGSAPRRGF